MKSALKLSNIKRDTATILIYKEIGGEQGVNGAWIAEDIQMLNEYYSDECKKINVRINSVGGSVQDGLSICSAILNSKIPVDTYIDGMAYSMAGVIAMCGQKRYMADYATFMMHNVQGSDDDEVIDLLTNSLAKIFERTTSLTIDKCKDLMKRETWMDSTECWAMGLIDEIITTEVSKKPEVSASIKQMQVFYNKLINPNHKQMNKLTNLLKLSNEASEDAIVAAVSEKDSEIEKLKQAITEAKNKQKEAEDKLAALEAATVTAERTAIIENAVKAGKIAADAKDIFINFSGSNADLSAKIETLKPVYTPVFDPKNQKQAPDGREKWTFDDWSKKDPKGLSEMAANNKSEFDRLINALPSQLSPMYSPENDKKF